jgi:hypothetical protein
MPTKIIMVMPNSTSLYICAGKLIRITCLFSELNGMRLWLQIRPYRKDNKAVKSLVLLLSAQLTHTTKLRKHKMETDIQDEVK